MSRRRQGKNRCRPAREAWSAGRHPLEYEATPARPAGSTSTWNERIELGGLPRHLSASIILVPEGYVSALCCERCGGRQDTLLDGRRLTRTESSPDELPDAVVDFHRRLEEELVPAWTLLHGECDGVPSGPRLPPVLEGFIESTIQRTTARLAAGWPRIPAEVFVVLEDGSARYIHLGEFKADPQIRHLSQDAAVAALGHVVRGIVAQAPSRALGVIYTEHGLCNGQGIGRAARAPIVGECMLFAVVTESTGLEAFTPIARDGGVPGEGNGSLGEVLLRPINVGTSHAVDGMMARAAPEGDAFVR